MSAKLTEDSLERAVERVSIAWLPPQKSVLSNIQEKFERGYYDSDRLALIADLKEDFSLFTYCIKELNSRDIFDKKAAKFQQAPDQKTQTDTDTNNPVSILLEAELQNLKNILQKEAEDISPHCFDEISPLQALRFRESLVSAATTELLAEKSQLDPDYGFSCAILRQLGLTLIAWNYPHVYAIAVEKLQSNVSLDDLLRRSLGFAPSLLGLAFAKRWNLSTEVLAMLGDEEGRTKNQEQKTKNLTIEKQSGQRIETLIKLCEVGEAFARANDPEHYPTALNDWEAAQKIIIEMLGPTGLELIYENAQKALRSYTLHIPEIINLKEPSSLKENIIEAEYGLRLFEKNLYLRQLPETLRREFKQLYGSFKPGRIIHDNIRTFINSLVPLVGFRQGCIYLFDPQQHLLNPAISHGYTAEERRRPVRTSSLLAQFEIVSSAFSLKNPLREIRVNNKGQQVTTIAYALGTTDRIGVLLLETTSNFSKSAGGDPMSLFRALHQCLCDCLNLQS